MILWTIQTEAAYQKLVQTGTLRGDGRRAHKYFRQPYKWLIGEMIKRIGKGYGNYPLWACYQYDYQRPKPDLRRSGHLPHSVIGYRIEFEIDDKFVLLSDFSNWHMVLNGDYLSVNEKDWDDFHREADEVRGSLYGPFPDQFKDRVIESWQNIFHLNFGDPDWHGPIEDRAIQATFWELKQEWVRDVTRFKAR